jgi:hypothetical protein
VPRIHADDIAGLERIGEPARVFMRRWQACTKKGATGKRGGEAVGGLNGTPQKARQKRQAVRRA